MSTYQSISRTFDLTLQTLTPLHIGTGNELELNIDYMTDGGQTHRLDVDRILENLWDESLDPARVRPAQLISSIPASERGQYYLYTAQGAVRAVREASKLRECIKTPDQKPYIPGSSLKGTLRTALAWAGWEEIIRTPLRSDDIGERKSWAGQRLEDRLFRPQRSGGDGPNKDLLRGLQVGDLHVVDRGRGWIVLNVQVAKNREFASPIEVEAVGGDAVFRGALHIDDYLFSPAAQKLGLANLKPWLDTLTKRVNAHTLYRLDLLIKRLGDMKHQGVPRLVEQLKSWQQQIQEFPDGRCVLCLGWGGGWDSKTFGSRLQRDGMFFEREVIGRFKLHRGNAPRKQGDPFPRTRRVIVRETQRDPSVAGLTGWCMLDLIPR